MAQPRPPQRVQYLCGLIGADAPLLARARDALADQLGPIDVVSPTYPFDLTDYYAHETGTGLLRQFVTFESLRAPDELPAMKHATNAIEAEFATDDAVPRPVNLDPGYLTQAKLVLASMKNFAHRIYLADGVYAEITLTYVNNRWVPTPWTFPDYAARRYDAFLTTVRDACRRKLDEETP